MTPAPAFLTAEWRWLALLNYLVDPAILRPRVPAGTELDFWNAEFITEHYWGYAVQRDGATLEYQVEHPPWRVWQAKEPALDCEVANLYGESFLAALGCPPASAFLAEGSAIIMRKGIRL